MPNTEIKNELLGIIDKIAELEIKQNEIRDRGIEIRDQLNVIRSKHFVEITLATNDKGKPLYPNERVRQSALTIAMDVDAKCKDLVTRLRTTDKELQEIVIEIGRLSSRKVLLMGEAGITNPPFPDKNSYGRFSY